MDNPNSIQWQQLRLPMMMISTALNGNSRAASEAWHNVTM
jgi:hypothetical protein